MIAVHALSLLAGVLLALGAVALPDAWRPVLPLCAGLLALLLPVLWRCRGSRAAAPLFTVLAGGCWAAWHLQQYQAALVMQADQRVLVTARIDSLPRRRGADVSFTAVVQALRGGSLADRTRHVRIDWRNAPPLLTGEQWQLLMVLNPPSTRANPGRRASHWQWLRDDLHGAGRVLPSRLNLRQRAAPVSIDGLRAMLAERLRGLVAERDAAALAVALAVGDTQYLSAEQWRVFNAVGITHLIAISGLHVTLFALLGAAAARRGWRHWRPLQRWRRDSVAGVIACTAAGGYALLAGFAVPAQRTLIMLVAWYLLRALARPLPAAPALSVALLAVLLLDPLASLSGGFWLSFVAVALLIHVAGEGGGWRGALRTQWVVTLGLLPVLLALAGNVSLVGLALNFVAIPLFTLLLVPLVLLATLLSGLPALAALPAALLCWLHGLLWPVLLWLAEQPFALWRLQPPWWWLLLCAPALFWLLWPWRWPMRVSAGLLLLPVLFPRTEGLREGEFAVTLLDVGRGLAVLVRTREHALLYDNGEAWSSDGATSGGTVLPALRSYRVRRLDRLLLPRLDADRSAGILALRAELPIDVLQAPPAAATLPSEFAACQAGRWRWNSVEFQLVDSSNCALHIAGRDGSRLLLAPRAATLLGEGDAPALVLLSRSARELAGPAAQQMLSAGRQSGTQVLTTAELGAIELRAGAGLQLRHLGTSSTKPY